MDAGLALRSKINEEARLYQELKSSGNRKRLESWKKDKAKEAQERDEVSICTNLVRICRHNIFQIATPIRLYLAKQDSDRKRHEEEARNPALRERRAE